MRYNLSSVYAKILKQFAFLRGRHIDDIYVIEKCSRILRFCKRMRSMHSVWYNGFGSNGIFLYIFLARLIDDASHQLQLVGVSFHPKCVHFQDHAIMVAHNKLGILLLDKAEY